MLTPKTSGKITLPVVSSLQAANLAATCHALWLGKNTWRGFYFQ